MVVFFFLKTLCSPLFVNQITCLLNLSSSTGVILKVWRTEQCSPLHEGDGGGGVLVLAKILEIVNP